MEDIVVIKIDGKSHDSAYLPSDRLPSITEANVIL